MRKKIIRTLAAALVISTTLVAPAYAEAAVVTGNSVNLRAGPGTFYYVITNLARNTPVTITDRSNSSWYAVSTASGETGFVSSAYLALSENDAAFIAPDFTPTPAVGTVGSANESTGSNASPSTGTVIAPDSSAAASSNTDYNAYINAMYVRFRSGPGSDYSVLGEYNRGKAVTTIGSGDGWTACIIDGQLGYVYTQYITAGASAASKAETTPAVQPSFGIPQPNETVTTPAATATPAQTPIITPPATLPSPNATALPSPSATPAPTTTPTPVQTPAASGKSGYINGTYVRFRSGPGTNHSILGTYHTGKTISVTADAGNGWYQCVIDGQVGYVYASYVLIIDQASFGGLQVGAGSSASGTVSGTTSVPNDNAQATVPPETTPTPTPAATPTPTPVQYKTAYIAGNNVRFRSAPSMTAGILGEFFYGNSVKLITAHDGWAQVMAENGQVGYVYSSYVKEGSYSVGESESGSNSSGSNESSSSQAGSASSATGQQIASYACQYVGYAYRWGGTSPDTGFDCSGLVQYVYKQFGYSLNRVAADQAKNGRHVEASELQPGDILCFYSGSSYIGHVGIYIGNGQFVHASNSTTGVIISSLAGYYVSRGFEARRIIG